MKKLDVAVWKRSDDKSYLVSCRYKQKRKRELNFEEPNEEAMYKRLESLSKMYIINLKFYMKAKTNFGFLQTHYWLEASLDNYLPNWYEPTESTEPVEPVSAKDYVIRQWSLNKEKKE